MEEKKEYTDFEKWILNNRLDDPRRGSIEKNSFGFYFDKRLVLAEHAWNESRKFYLDQQQQERDRELLIAFCEQLKDYTSESCIILGYDEREASEFVDQFLAEQEKK